MLLCCVIKYDDMMRILMTEQQQTDPLELIVCKATTKKSLQFNGE